LLGLKGSLNEYELDLLRQRSVEARREKARRGELLIISPVGYRKGEQRLEKDPDGFSSTLTQKLMEPLVQAEICEKRLPSRAN